MDNYDDLYCKLFLDTDFKRQFLAEMISMSVSGKIGFNTIDSDLCEIYIDDNDDFDKSKLSDEDGFLYWRYYLDINPKEGIIPEDYISLVLLLMKYLRELNCQVVAVCDFEDLLIEIQ